MIEIYELFAVQAQGCGGCRKYAHMADAIESGHSRNGTQRVESRSKNRGILAQVYSVKDESESIEAATACEGTAEGLHLIDF